MITSGLSSSAANWLRAHHEVATTAELRRLGVGRKALDRLVRLDVLRRIGRGVYVVTCAEQTLHHRCRVLCGLYPSGFVTGTTAAMLEGLRRQPRFAALQFCVSHGVHLDEMTGVAFRQSTKVDSSDRVVRPDGIVVASPRRMAFDTARDLRAIDHRSVVHQLLDRRLVTAEELVATGERLCHPARRGSTTFRLSLQEIGAPQDSHPEVLLLDALVRRGLPVEAQAEVRRPDGPPVHLDIAVTDSRWGVELDIHPEHRSVDGHHRDARRLRSLHVAGWQIETVSELDMVDAAAIERVADELTAIYRERSGADPSVGVPTGGR